MMWSDGSVGWAGWIVMSVGMLAFWSLIVWIMLAMFNTGAPKSPPDAMRQLDERFARGEIDIADYHVRQQALRSSASARTSARSGVDT